MRPSRGQVWKSQSTNLDATVHIQVSSRLEAQGHSAKSLLCPPVLLQALLGRGLQVPTFIFPGQLLEPG